MCKRKLLSIVAMAVLMSGPVWADLIQVHMQLLGPQGGSLYAGTADVANGVEFAPFHAISFDFTGGGAVTFQPLVSGNFIAYDAIFTVAAGTPFRGVSTLLPAAGDYRLSYDPVQQAILFHHSMGYDAPGTVLRFQADPAHAPEPSSLLLFGTGVLVAARLVRRRSG